MKIIILGAGRIGESGADTLVSERNDITVVDADTPIACAAQDEINRVCCKVAHQVFGIPRRIARVRFVAHEDGGAQHRQAGLHAELHRAADTLVLAQTTPRNPPA